MRKDRLAVTASTKITDPAKQMEEHSGMYLPVKSDGKVGYSVSRHDLLRAWIGFGLGMGIDS